MKSGVIALILATCIACVAYFAKPTAEFNRAPVSAPVPVIAPAVDEPTIASDNSRIEFTSPPATNVPETPPAPPDDAKTVSEPSKTPQENGLVLWKGEWVTPEERDGLRAESEIAKQVAKVKPAPPKKLSQEDDWKQREANIRLTLAKANLATERINLQWLKTQARDIGSPNNERSIIKSERKIAELEKQLGPNH